jgi:hypothetical protein
VTTFKDGKWGKIMKNFKYFYIVIVWILILSLLFQSNSAFASNELEMKNTAPVANFTVEKSREVKLLVLTDYAGAENANLKNALTSMRSELANYAKINIEYASPTDKIIGTQNGSVTINYWGINGYATYKKTGYTWSVNPYGQTSRQDFNNTQVTDNFVYSTTIELPEGQTPTQPYGVPNRYTKSSKKTDTANQMGNRDYYEWTFMNASGICAGKFAITTQYAYYYPNSAVQELSISFTEPTFTYDTAWSIQGSQDTSVTNSVTGWDLSKLNYDVPSNTDTFVIFALNNEDTNYYTSHLASNYRLGQLRNDSNLGKFVKDSEARVYSICSDTLENVNLSTNPQYPVTFNGAAQNISLRDLIESSFDGRSIGQKNITGLVNKIKENVKRPSDKVDMIVATDKDISSTNSFVNSIKDNISSDVDFKTNIVNMDSLEDVNTWKKYVTKGDYKSYSQYNTDATLLLCGNGELWARGSNKIGWSPIYNKDVYGLFGQSTTIQTYSSFIKIATDVKDAYFYYSSSGYSIYIIKNDGSLWVCGANGVTLNSHLGYDMPIQYQEFTNTYWTGVKSLAFDVHEYGTMYMVTDTGVYRRSLRVDNYYLPVAKDPYAPANTQYVIGVSDSMLYYISDDGDIDFTYWSSGTQQRGLNHSGKLPYPVKDYSTSRDTARQTAILCTDNKIYNLQGQVSINIPIKQAIMGKSTYGVTYLVATDGVIYSNTSGGWSTYGVPAADKILFIQDNSGATGGMVVRTPSGEIGYIGRINYENILKTDITSTYDPARYYANNGGGYATVFDASVGDTAADYLQIGNHFAYVTKQGNICYINCDYLGVDDYGLHRFKYTTVNCGKVDSAFDITNKPVKAFSKSKIFNTQLRDGSERYFIYISDNVKKDTYFHDPSDYLLLDNLDSTVLNYLNTNGFNIYVVSPAEARDLKLQYPYVPVNRQQYSLKELIYNSVMDSAFCKDENTVKTLITRKYDTFTKQGSTTLTLLVNEESVRYNQIYSDFEHHSKYSDKWQYTHDPTYFDNSNGLDGNSGKWITEPLYTFSKVGKYTVVAQFRDNPKDDNRFDSYRLWSNVSAPATIIVHRRPIALFTVSSRYNETTKLCTLRANNTSYDLDHQISRSDKGIAQSSFEYKLSTDSTWSSGLPTNVPVNKTYNMRLKVRDIEGAWSNYYYQDFTTVPVNSNEPPEVTITKSLSYVYEGDDLDIIMKPIDPDNDSLNLALEEKKDSGSWKTVFTKTACASGSTQTYSITKIPAGNYQYRVSVTDPDGESGSASLSFTAYPLGINGVVDHTPIWKLNWINYNKHLQSIGKTTYGNDAFFTGEKYILSATTTQISESSITASNVSVKIVERNYSPVLLTKQSSNTFTGDMWNEDMRGTRWRGKQATFLFTVTYSNGTVKTDTVVTNIIDDDYFRVKMSF